MTKDAALNPCYLCGARVPEVVAHVQTGPGRCPACGTLSPAYFVTALATLPAPEAATAHVRAPLARRGGNSTYRDTRPRVAATLCGAPVTAQDVPAGTARKAAREGWRVCAACLAALPPAVR